MKFFDTTTYLKIHFNFLPKPIFSSGSLVVISEETNGSRGHNGENDDGAQYGDYHGLWRDWKQKDRHLKTPLLGALLHITFLYIHFLVHIYYLSLLNEINFQK